MKPTSPLSLLLFLQLASSAPILCPSQSCRQFLTKPNTPPSRIPSEPHFPLHQITSSDDTIIDNHAQVPSDHLQPSVVLSVEKPLSSAFLLSLSKSSSTLQKSPVQAIAASKPTSALPELRRGDARRYWAAIQTGESESRDELEMGPSNPHTVGKSHCGKMMVFKVVPGRYYVRERASYVVREYSDGIVVGIVLLFLVIVVCVEAVEKFGYLYVSPPSPPSLV